MMLEVTIHFVNAPKNEKLLYDNQHVSWMTINNSRNNQYYYVVLHIICNCNKQKKDSSLSSQVWRVEMFSPLHTIEEQRHNVLYMCNP